MNQNVLDKPAKIEIVKDKLAKAKLEVAGLEKEIERIMSSCSHKWDVQYVPPTINTFDPTPQDKAYYGDSWGISYPLSKKTERSWVRKCSICGLVQTAYNTILVYKEDGSGLRDEVPDFGSRK